MPAGGQVATPQAIVNGRAATNGGDRNALITTIRRADRGATGPAIVAAADKVKVGPDRTPTSATVWLVRYDSRTLAAPIRAGENDGKTLAHRNMVRSIEPLGTWTGATASWPVAAAADPAYRTAVLVQQGRADRSSPPRL